jgi:hypothetical protein
MTLFYRNKEIEKKYFSKEEVIRNIKENIEEKSPRWKIIDSYNILNFKQDEINIPDLLCIRSVNINKEISIEDNVFSHYRRTVPSTYQILVGVYITPTLDDIYHFSHNLWRSINVDSADLLFMKLNEEQ